MAEICEGWVSKAKNIQLDALWITISVRPTRLHDRRGDQVLMPAWVQHCGSSSEMPLLG
jgi:hypothetical protein